MRMLSNDDLSAIGSLIDVKLEPVLEAVRDGFDEMDRDWDKKLDERLGRGLGALRNDLMDHTDRTVTKAVGELRVELKGDMGELRTELKGDMKDLRTELKGDMAGLRTELKDD